MMYVNKYVSLRVAATDLDELVDGVLGQRVRVGDVQRLQPVELAQLHQLGQDLWTK